MMAVFIALALVFVAYCGIEQLYASCWQNHLEVSVSLPSEACHEGDTAQVEEVIVNDKFLPLPILETFFPLDKGLRYQSAENAMVSDKQYRRDVFAVGMKRKIKRTFAIRCEKRGYYTLTGVELMSSDVFLRQKLLAKCALFSDFYVYPRKVQSSQLELPYRQLMGQLLIHKRLLSDPFSFGGMREYTDTDPMNTINWSASAKAQNLMVNVYDCSVEQKVTIVLDTFENTGSYSEALSEECIRIAAALAERLLCQGIVLSLFGNGLDCMTQQPLALQQLKGQSVVQVKQALARLSLDGEMPVEALFSSLERDTFVVLISKNKANETAFRQQRDCLWILPYRGEKPTDLGGLANVSLWEYNTGYFS